MERPARDVIRDVTVPGMAAFGLAGATLVSPFVTASIWETSPMWIFFVGAAMGILSIVLGIRAVTAPKGSPGRGAGWVGIAIAPVGIVFSLFIWAIASMVINDTTL